MVKLGKKVKENKNSITAYACICVDPCHCNCGLAGYGEHGIDGEQTNSLPVENNYG